jgi:hypothetical protein
VGLVIMKNTTAFETLTTEQLDTATGGGGKAYTFGHDSKTDPRTCFATADRVGKSYGLKLVGNGTDRQLVSRRSGEQAGTAYTERGNCHIYVN